MNKKSKPAPQTITIGCGYCAGGDAEVILPDKTIVCKDCARKQGFEVVFNITAKRFASIRKKIGKLTNRNIPAWMYGRLLGFEGKKSGVQVAVFEMERNVRKIAPGLAEEALRIEQLSAEDLKFLISQAELRK